MQNGRAKARFIHIKKMSEISDGSVFRMTHHSSRLQIRNFGAQ